VIKAELKRCIRIERRWNRNEVSRGSPDKEDNRRPTSLKKFTADYYYFHNFDFTLKSATFGAPAGQAGTWDSMA